MLDRRNFLLAGLAGGVAGSLPAGVLASDEISSEGLGALAAKSGLLFGTAFPYRALGDARYLSLIAQHAKVLTLENHFKFDHLNPTGKGLNFSRVDEMHDFATKIDAKIFAQPLFWNDNYPRWLDKLSIKELQRVFDAHIENVVSRYAGKFHSLGVVNEPFAPWDNLPNSFRDGPWYWAFGESYVSRALRAVAKIDPKVRLVINEAQCENEKWGTTVRPQLLTLVDRLLDEGVPLHGIGLQGHLQPQLGFDYEAHARFIEDIGSRGLDIFITELDVNDMDFSRDHAKRDLASAVHYQDYLTHVLSQPALKMLIVWNLADPYSWYRDIDQGWGKDARALLFDGDFEPKPAYFALENALRARVST